MLDMALANPESLQDREFTQGNAMTIFDQQVGHAVCSVLCPSFCTSFVSCAQFLCALTGVRHLKQS
jgi:hypothetical protein